MDTRIEKVNILIEMYKRYLQIKAYAETTIESYERAVKKFIKHIKEDNIQDIRQIDKKQIQKYQRHISVEQGNSFQTQFLKLIAIKSFFKYLEKEEIILFNPAINIELPKVEKRLPKHIFNEKEIKDMLKAIDVDKPIELRDRSMLELIYSSGVRTTELLNLNVYDIDKENKRVKIREGKGKRPRIVPVGEIAIQYIKEYLAKARPVLVKDENTETLFVGQRGNRLHRRRIPQIVQKYAKRSKIKHYVCAHMIRHSMATHMLRRNAPIRYIQEMLGHKSLNTTQRYTKVEIKDLQRVYRRTHPREIN